MSRIVRVAGVALALSGCEPDGEAGTPPAPTTPTWSSLPGDPARGEALFEEHCASCHAGEGVRLTECEYERYVGWQAGDLAHLTLDQLVLQVIYGGDCMPPMAVPLEHPNGLGEPPMFTREEVEDVVSYVADRFGRP